MQQDTNARILIVEDSRTLALTYDAYLAPLKSTVVRAATGQEGLDALAEFMPHLVILDLKLPDMDGIDILQILARDYSETKVIVITAHGSVQVAVDAMRSGATDFLLKPFNADRLLTTARNALELQRLTKLVATIESEHRNYGKFVGASAPMKAIYRMIQDAAPSSASVFITGESGTGKEVCAETLHNTGPRKSAPFVAINCAAIPSNLMESEIFGHKRGAFTGANEDRIGAAERADGGTLFLDEICEMPLELQAKLLRFIQTGQFLPVGGTRVETVNVRFVCATNRSPWEEVSAGRFREDLYYRLHVIPIHLPALRDRGDDIMELARFFLEHFSREESKDFKTISADAAYSMMHYHWPGNVRELANVIQGTVVLKDGPELTHSMISPKLGMTPNQSDQGLPELEQVSAARTNRRLPTLAEAEERLIEAALNETSGNMVQAAALLGVHPSTLYRKRKHSSA